MTKTEQSFIGEKAKWPHAGLLSPWSRVLAAPKTLGHTRKGQLEGGAPSGPQHLPSAPDLCSSSAHGVTEVAAVFTRQHMLQTAPALRPSHPSAHPAPVLSWGSAHSSPPQRCPCLPQLLSQSDQPHVTCTHASSCPQEKPPREAVVYVVALRTRTCTH